MGKKYVGIGIGHAKKEKRSGSNPDFEMHKSTNDAVSHTHLRASFL